MCFWFEGSMQKKRDGEKCTVTGEADALKKVGLKISRPKSGLSSGWYAKARGSHVACLDLVTCKPGEKTAAWKKLSSWQLGNSATQDAWDPRIHLRKVVFASTQTKYFSLDIFCFMTSWQHDHLYGAPTSNATMQWVGTNCEGKTLWTAYGGSILMHMHGGEHDNTIIANHMTASQ